MILNNIKLVGYLLAIVGGLQIINIILGSVNGMMEETFEWKKFFIGILKAIVNAICIVATCVLCDLFAQVLNMIEGLSIGVDLVSTIEIIAVVVVWAIDLFKDIFEKIKKLRTLKYISYEDVVPYGENTDVR